VPWSLVYSHQSQCKERHSGLASFDTFLPSIASATDTRRRIAVAAKLSEQHLQLPVAQQPAAQLSEQRILHPSQQHLQTTTDDFKPKIAAPPQAPRNLECASSGFNFIQLTWQPPVSTGGAPVFEYEVTFKLATSLGDKKPVSMPRLLTSRWCCDDPVANHGFKVEHLRSGLELVDLAVRCRNEAGWGPASNRVASASTLEPQGPSPPLFFAATNVTATTIRLQWQAPFDDGGSRVVAYEVSYDAVHPKVDFSKGDVGTTELGRHTVNLLGRAREYLFTNLEPGCEHTNLR